MSLHFLRLGVCPLQKHYSPRCLRLRLLFALSWGDSWRDPGLRDRSVWEAFLGRPSNAFEPEANRETHHFVGTLSSDNLNRVYLKQANP